MTPPFGFNLFYLKGVAPPEVTMSDIYWSVTPYVLVTMLRVLLIIIFPEIALFLPNLFFGQVK
jgi:TRAP-type mannitol/chloroaromatic compound transport system permease large subunit